MALAFTSLAAAGDTNNVSPYATTSITPAANSLLVVGIIASGTSVAVPTISGLGLTWSFVKSVTAGATGLILAVYTAQCGASPGSGALSIAVSTTPTGAGYSVVQVTGAATSTPVVQSPTNSGATVSVLTVTLAAAASANNYGLAFFETSNNTANTITAPAGWTELSEVLYATPSNKIETRFSTAGLSTSATTAVTCTEDSTYNMGGIALEIAAAGAAAPATPTRHGGKWAW